MPRPAPMSMPQRNWYHRLRSANDGVGVGSAHVPDLNVGSSSERCRSSVDRFWGILAPSLAGESLCPMSWPRSVPKCDDQTDGGIRPVVARKKGRCCDILLILY